MFYPAKLQEITNQTNQDHLYNRKSMSNKDVVNQDELQIYQIFISLSAFFNT